MTLQNSPGFDHDLFSETGNENEPESKKRAFRWLILGLVVILLALVVGNFWQSGLTDVLRGKGNVSGIVIDQNGNGVKAEVMVTGTNLATYTDDGGRFLLAGIPEGQRVLVIGYDLTGWEYPVTVVAGQTMELGKISVIATATP